MNEKVLECIYTAIDEVNLERSGKAPLAKASDTPIFGPSSDLDSLELVNFVVLAEDSLERAFDAPVLLSGEQAFDAEPSPFRSVGALAEYVEGLLGDA